MILPSWCVRVLPPAIWLVGWLPFWRSHPSLPDALAALTAAVLYFFAVLRLRPNGPTRISRRRLGGALALVAAGTGLGLTLPIAIGLVLVAGLGVDTTQRRTDELRLLALLSLPWLATDASALALVFRHTAAWATEQFFGGLGYAVAREGTTINLAGQPLGVVAACAGLDTLHATLVAGLWLAGVLRARRRFWLGVVFLPALAWAANTIRVIALGGVALAWGPDVASGWFHDWGGLSVIILMFALAGTWIALLSRGERKR